MSLLGGVATVMRHSMRAYYLPLVAGLLLSASAFMPWIMMGEQRFGGVPDLAGLGVLGLGLVAVMLATLSVITRKNSRHPLLLVGLGALTILLMAERFMERSVADQAWAQSQARAIVQGGEVEPLPEPATAVGAYLGFSASAIITLFGLTIVVRRVAQPYAKPEDDDV